MNIIAVTLKDVAREAGVSAHSVSAVLNGKADQYRISQPTRVVIEKMARQLGYDPDNNRGARQMAARKHGIKILNNVIAVCSNIDSGPLHQEPFASDILNGVENGADQYGMDVLQCRLRPGRFPRLIQKGEVDGIIVLNLDRDVITSLQQLDIPMVKLGSFLPTVHSVSANHHEGILQATSHLINLGHHDIAFIGHDFTRNENESTLLDAARQRFVGFEDALRGARLPVKYVDTSIIEHCPEAGARAFQHLWKKSKRKITAVVCYNDMFAMGVIQAAREIGLKIPEDLSVVGFDGVSKNYAFEPAISSVAFDRVLMGKRAVEILMQFRGERYEKAQTVEFIREELPIHFVEEATTALPRKS